MHELHRKPVSRAAHYYFAFLFFLLFYLFISLKYYIWEASSARLHFWFKKITCQNVSSRGGRGRTWGGGGCGGRKLNRVPMLELVLRLKTISFEQSVFFPMCLIKKKNNNIIFQQSSYFPTLNDNLTLRTVRKEFFFFVFFFFFCSRISTKMCSKIDIPIPQIGSKQRHRNKHDERKCPFSRIV